MSQAAGLVLLAVVLALLDMPLPARADWILGGVAGILGGVGVAWLYRALAIGVMAVVAPITAICAVLVPVAIAVALGERPGIVASAGIGLSLIAILLVSHQPGAASSPERGRGVLLAFAAGVAIGLFFYALARTSPTAGLWPLVAARVVSVTFFLTLAAIARISVRVPHGVALVAAAGGVLDMLANLLYLLATRAGPLTLVVTLSSLYPASTVLLARLVLHERLTPRQWAGVTCALVAIAAIVTG